MHAFCSPDVTAASFTKKKLNNYKQLDFFYELGNFVTNFTLNHQAMVEILRRTNHRYDVVILETANNIAMFGLGHHFKAPLIGYTPMGATMWNMDYVGTPAPYSFVPHQLMICSDRMTFLQRLENTLLSSYDFFKFIRHSKHQNEIYQSVFTDINKPTIDELKKSLSIVFVNQQVAIAHPQPYMPNMIDIGGIHINRNRPQRLPADIYHFVNDAPYGVIYFSLGSIVKTSNLPSAQRDGLLRAFSKLKERVLWKWEDPDLPGKSDNVMISKWFPQQDLLAHSNMKLFISHGGLLSVMEAVYHAVPIIGIPIFGDHFLNMFRAQNAGYGLTVSLTNLTENTISWAINEILSNDK